MPLRQQIVQPIQHQGSISASAQFLNQVVTEHSVHHVQPDGTVMPQVVLEHLVRNIQPNLHNYQGGNLNYQYQPPSPQAQYQPGGLTQPQFAPQYGQFEPLQQQSQGAAQQRPWADVIADVMREQFGLKPKETGSLYRQPYPDWFERIPLPNRFKVLDFSKFSEQDGVSTYEHISRFLAQCGEASAVDALKKVTLHEHRSAEVWKNSKKVNHVCPYMYGSDDDEDDSEIAAAEWVRSKKMKYDKQQEKHHEEYDYGFDPHWGCEFFRFCWNEGMRLPSIENCPGCSDIIESSSRSYNRGNRLRQTRVSVHQRLGPGNQDHGQQDNVIRKNQWCPSGIFTKNQKSRVQRLRNRERLQEVEQEINHRLKKEKPRQECRVKNQVPVADDVAADEAKRLAKGKSVVMAPVNMVFTLPAEFGIDQADVDEVEEESAKLVLSPEQAVFEKPEGTENRHLKPLYINGYVNGKLMSKMMVDVGAAVNLMPFATFRKLGRNAEGLIKTNMVIKDFGGNLSETKGILNVELTVGSKTISTTFFVTDGKGSYSLLLRRDWIHANCCIPSTMHQCLIQWQGDKIEIVPADRWRTQAIILRASWRVHVYTKDTVDDLDDKQGQGFMLADDLEEIDIGPGDRSRPTFISKNLTPEFRTKLIELLKEFRDSFAWEYYEMPGFSQSIVEHRLPIKPGVKPHQQPPRRCKADMLQPVKAEIKRLYDAGFIRPCRYAEWVSSIVPVIKKNGKLRAYIDFRDLNKATPKDEYPMPVADQLVDAASGNKILSFMAEEDIHKTTFRCPGAIGLFEWVVMTFGLKSAGATYQRAMNYIYHDLIGWLVEVYIDDVVVKSKEIKDHIADLRKVFKRTRKYGLKMNPTNGIGLVIISPRGACFEFAYTIKPYATNNQVECEAVLKGLQLLKEVESDTIQIMGDSLLVINQLAGEYECKNDTLMVYNEKCQELMKEFRLVTLKHVSREQNIEANDLVQGASGYKPMIKDVKVEVAAMTVDDWRYYKGGQDCQKFGAIQRAPASAMNPIIKPWPFRGWGIDMIGMINPPSSKGHKFILVATDYFTKWVEAIPLKKVDSGDAIQFVQEHIIYRFGIPLTTDQGLIFVSDEFVQFADSMGIKLLNSSPYYAQANGQAKASNKSLIKLIKRKISDYPWQWHTRLAEALWSYRMACHGSIQVPPYKLVYGHEAVLPWEVRIGSQRMELQNDLRADEYYNLMADEREDLGSVTS
uniref:OSIGBa0160I04.5 protein n=1 Tax=Oryza sativa TaxID=4530 RepID=Q01MY6_ORYSA|nr:OSIGBa0160I04.5 [Oryza sativa]